MLEKHLAICDLFDRYAAVLSPRHREVLDFYYNQDLSLSEIAAEIGISRQGVRDAIKKAEEELFALEAGLHLCHTAGEIAAAASKLLSLSADAEIRRAVLSLCAAAGVEPSENE